MPKKILLTGTSSYVGNHLEAAFQKKGEVVERISMRTPDWKTTDFNGYDVVIHLAALVHGSDPHASLEDYLQINCELTKEVAIKAKAEGVRQFVFFSTMAVFGLEGKIEQPIQIDGSTVPNPQSPYGKSKLKAENHLQQIAAPDFHICIVRPPMIYGPGAPGNFARLEKLARILPFYPRIDNARSSIYIGNLERYIMQLVAENKTGYYHPQNSYYLHTNQAIAIMRAEQGKKIHTIPIPKMLKNLLGGVSTANKVYGSLVYSHDLDKEKIVLEEIGLEASLSRNGNN